MFTKFEMERYEIGYFYWIGKLFARWIIKIATAKSTRSLPLDNKFLLTFYHNQKHQNTPYERTTTMPVIQFGQRDILRGKVVTPGWYKVHVESVGEAPSRDQGSTNYPVEGTIIHNADNGDKEFTGVPVDWNFNSKAIGFAVGFLAAFGVEVKPDTRFDLANAAGKDVDIYVENGEYQGRIVNRVNHKYRACQEVAG